MDVSQTTVPQALAAAVRHHQTGDLKTAEEIYRAVLKVQPAQPDALQLLGVICHQTGRSEMAVDQLSLGVAVNPGFAEGHYNLAKVLQDLGRLGEAVGRYREAVRLKPDFADAYYNLANALRDLGRGEDAAAAYRQAIRTRPDYVKAHTNLGGLLLDRGEKAEAVACHRRAVELRPNYAEGFVNLGNSLRQLGKHDEAAECCRTAIRLRPDHPEAHYNLGCVHQDRRQWEDAEAAFRQAAWFKPDYAKAHTALGAVLLARGKAADAAACHRRALELQPEFVEAHTNLGIALEHLGKLGEAAASLRRALELSPDYPEACANLGTVLQQQGKLDEAERYCRRALELKPNLAEAHTNLGAVLHDQGRPEEAAACHRRALELNPDLAEAYTNLGVVWQDQGKLHDATDCYRKALERDPDSADAHSNLAVLRLISGNFQEGWPEYEWRWRTKRMAPARFRQPRWTGEDLAGKTILLWSEQGLGDTMQFIRYAPIVRQLGATVVVQCRPALAQLLARSPGIDVLVREGDALPDFDFHAPLLSLPGILKTSLESIPASVPYVFALPELAERWRERIGQALSVLTSKFSTPGEGWLSGQSGGVPSQLETGAPLRRFAPGTHYRSCLSKPTRIGINWQGNPSYRADRDRSMPLTEFAPLASVPGVSLISLQKGPGSEQVGQLGGLFPVLDLSAELDAHSGPFMDTAAVMMNLDLVITSDTAIAHLAGALAVPVWVALPTVPDWRWLLDRHDSPWYPTMRLFRQKERGQWQDVFRRIAEALRERIKSQAGAPTNVDKGGPE